MNQSQKFALGGGGYVLYAPRFPRYQTMPGFADPVSLFNVELPRMFVLSILEEGAPRHLQCDSVTVADGVAKLVYTGIRGVKIHERRFVTGDDRCVSVLEIDNTSKTDRQLEVVMWTTTDPEGEPPSLEGDSVRVRRALSQDGSPPVPTEIVLSSPDSKGARCLQGFFANGGSDRPDWEETPWFDRGELPTPRAKRPMEKPSPIVAESSVYIGVFRPIKLKGGSRVEHRFEANVIFKGKGINYRPRRPDPKDEAGYQAFMDKAPRFTCEDKNLEKLVHGRIEALRLLRMPQGVGNLSSPSIAAGNGPLHVPMAFAAPAILREARWLGDPSYGRGLLKVFFENVRQSGMVPSRIYATGLSNTEFYHADWGGGFEAFDAIHSDRATKRAVIMAMQRYTKWLANNRDPEGSGLTDVCNQLESGQQLSRRFTIIDDKSDRSDEFSEQFRLKAVDASVFRYRLVRYLARVADELQEKAMANRFIAASEVIQEVVRKRMWDPKSNLFVDIDPKTRRKTGVKSAVGFYPLATDIPKQAQVDAMLKTLADRNEFWAKYPIPTLAMSDPTFDADAQWKGTRHEEPWNGRVWPMVNSQVLEGLCHVAERGNKQAQKLTKELFKRMMRMLSGELDGADVPTVLQHYSPVSGRGSRFRGIDLLLHSFVMDNVFRIACGFVIRYGEIQDDPVIDDMPDFKLNNVPLGNKRFAIERKNGKLKVSSE